MITIIGAVGFVMSAHMAGCASSADRAPDAPDAPDAPGAVDDLDRPPSDFNLDVVILAGRSVPDRGAAHERPGHFIVLPDGSLLHESGATIDWSQRPGRTRVLYQQQVTDLWRIARELGFTVPSSADYSGNPKLIEPQRDETIYIMAFAADGQRWTFVRAHTVGEEPDAASVRLIRALADLAWSPDLTADRFLPVRYDFGPDPYAGFRRRGAK